MKDKILKLVRKIVHLELRLAEEKEKHRRNNESEEEIAELEDQTRKTYSKLATTLDQLPTETQTPKDADAAQVELFKQFLAYRRMH